jgi:phosphatidylinositol-3-phosphatase
VRTIPIALLVAACSSHPGNSSNTTDGPNGTTDGQGSGNGSGSGSGSGTTMIGSNATVFTILFENHDYKEIVSSGSGSPGAMNAPYINSLIAQYGLATNYKDTNHPSTPNYLHLISGSDQYPGVFDELPTYPVYFPANQPHIGTQFIANGINWRSYSEDEGSAGCNLANDGNYVPRHDPFLYFTDIQKGSNNICAETNVDYSLFAADLATNDYRYMWITPNLLDDGHNPSTNSTTDPPIALQQSDTWLSQNLPAILASDGYKNGGIVFITWDEAEGRNGDDPDQIPMIVISPRLKSAGMTVDTAFTHSAYTATIDDLFGFTRLATVTSSPSLMAFFN